MMNNAESNESTIRFLKPLRNSNTEIINVPLIGKRLFPHLTHGKK